MGGILGVIMIVSFELRQLLTTRRYEYEAMC